MREHSARRTLLVASAALLAGLAVGGGAVAVASTLGDSAEPGTLVVTGDDAEFEKLTVPDYETNGSGQTLGEHKIGTVPPNLLEAETDEGESGYIYTKDLYGTDDRPSTPDEAVERTQKLLTEGGEIVVSVYAADGQTRIGEFVAGTVSQSDEAKD